MPAVRDLEEIQITSNTCYLSRRNFGRCKLTLMVTARETGGSLQTPRLNSLQQHRRLDIPGTNGIDPNALPPWSRAIALVS